MAKYDVEKVRKDFPGLKIQTRNNELLYLDSAASALKPNCVIDRLAQFYRYESSNIHRGAHYLGDQATRYFEGAREDIARFIGAKKSDEIIFTRGTTESINLVASSLGDAFLKEGDEILITIMEHHSNIVPWQMLAQRTKAKLQVAPIFDNGELDLEAFRNLLSEKTKIVSVVHCSNAIGTVNDVKTITALAHDVGAKVLIDGAQSVTNQVVDVSEIGCDFFAFSGHKLFGPYGIGVLYGRSEVLSEMPPYQGGGSMIDQVSFEGTSFNDAPFRFEAGTPHIAGAIGLQAAVHYVQSLGIEAIQEHEQTLLRAATEQFLEIPGVQIIGQAPHKASILSFVMKGAHPSDVGHILDEEGVAVRAGHHCTQPLMKRLGVPATVRASFSIYNNMDDVERLVAAVRKAKEIFE